MTGFEKVVAPRPPRWRWPMLIPWHWPARRRCYRCRWALDAEMPPELRADRKPSRYVWITGLPGFGDASVNIPALCVPCWESSTVDERVQAHVWLWDHLRPLPEMAATVRLAVEVESGVRSSTRVEPGELDELVDLLAARLHEWVMTPVDEDLRRGRYGSMYTRSVDAEQFVMMFRVIAWTARAEGRELLDELDYVLKLLDDFRFGPLDGIFLRAKIIARSADLVGPRGGSRNPGTSPTIPEM